MSFGNSFWYGRKSLPSSAHCSPTFKSLSSFFRAFLENVVAKLAIGCGNTDRVIGVSIRAQGFGHKAESDGMHLDAVLLLQESGIFGPPDWWQAIGQYLVMPKS